MKDENNMEMLFYLLIHASIFILSNMYKLLNEKKIISSIKNENKNNLENEIKTLKKEAERHNTPNEFVTYSKMMRRINKLEEELKSQKSYEHFNNKEYKRNEENELKFFSNMINSYSSSSVIYTNIFMWILTILEYFFLRKKYFIFKYKDFPGNILIEYYHKKNEELVKIPLKTILICETIVLNQLNIGIKNFFSK